MQRVVAATNGPAPKPYAAPLRQFEHVVTGERGNAVASSNRPSSKPMVAPIRPSEKERARERVQGQDAFVRTPSDLYRTLDDMKVKDDMLGVGGGGEKMSRVGAGQQIAGAVHRGHRCLDGNETRSRPLNGIAYNIQKNGGQKSVLMHLNDLQVSDCIQIDTIRSTCEAEVSLFIQIELFLMRSLHRVNSN